MYKTNNNHTPMATGEIQHFIEQLPVAAFAAYGDGRYPLYSNHSLAELMGGAGNNWRDDGGFWLKRIQPADLARVEAVLVAAADGKSAGCDFRINAVNGGERRLRCDVCLLPTEGAAQVILGVVTDPARSAAGTDRQPQESDQLQMVSPVVVYRRSPGNGYPIVGISGDIKRLLGYDAGQLLENPALWLQSVHPDDRERVAAGLGNLASLGHCCHDYRVRHRDGHYVWLRDELKLSHDAAGKVRDIVGAWLDVSCGKQMEAERNAQERKLELTRKMQAIGTLAGGIAHEFNNMLGVIVGYSELIAMQAAGGGKIYDYTQHVLHAAQRSKDLVQQLLSMARKKQQYQPATDMRAQLSAEVELLRPTLPPGVQLSLDIDVACARTMVDPGELRLILAGLVDNAVQAMSDAGQLRICAYPAASSELAAESLHGDYTCLQVSDTGIGMSSEIMARIYEPFYSTRPVGEGRGLGLAIIYSIIEGSGGKIVARSAPGEGACFSLYFPVACLVDKAASTTAVGVGATVTGKRILVVDDEPMFCELGKLVLGELGNQVDTASNAAEALRQLIGSRAQYDLVITDQIMPDIQGTDLARAVLALRPQTRILLCTGYSGDTDQQALLDLGIRGVVFKPYSREQLLDAISAIFHAQ